MFFLPRPSAVGSVGVVVGFIQPPIQVGQATLSFKSIGDFLLLAELFGTCVFFEKDCASVPPLKCSLKTQE